MKPIIARISIIILCLGAIFPAIAQKTGSFDASINFMGQPRQLSLYVPASYSSSNPCALMICLHGLGDNSVNYRNALLNPLSFPSYAPNTIFICPEAANSSQDFFSPAGGEQIIQECINYARQNYSIDTSNIVLQGFSLGGRAALRYGLEHYSTFRGLLLNTPAIQSVKEGMNLSIYGYTFNYNNAPKIPIFITHGGADILYTGPIDTMYHQLIQHNGLVRYFEFPGLGHTIPAIPNFIRYQKFFAAPYNAAYDLDIIGIQAADRSCTTTMPASVLVRNTGQNNISSIQLQYTLNGTPATHTWNGALAPAAHTYINLPTLTAAAGMNILTVKILSLNGSISDTVTANNMAADTFTIASKGATLPISESFEGTLFPPAGWLLHGSGDAYPTWGLDNTVMRTGKNSMSAFNTIFIFENSGMKEDLFTPVLDLSTQSNPELSFDLAFNYVKYTPPYFVRDTIFADTLEIALSNNCGASFSTLYRKGGKDLATFKNPILNPLSLNADFITPADTNWRKERISLNGFSSATQAVLRFRYISALGGSINIDNVRVGTSNVGISETDLPAFNLYPNPASDMLYINAGSNTILSMEMTDLAGRCVLSKPLLNIEGETLSINTSGLINGIYFLKIHTPTGIHSEKLIIQK